MGWMGRNCAGLTKGTRRLVADADHYLMTNVKINSVGGRGQQNHVSVVLMVGRIADQEDMPPAEVLRVSGYGKAMMAGALADAAFALFDGGYLPGTRIKPARG